ncbi:MAG: hypothetical protein EXR99_08970 [Gemmataceae bacterium]|nr:hypothetical protein [Gemmataceae bacterium]
MQPDTVNPLEAAFLWYTLVAIWVLFSVVVGSFSLQTGAMRDGQLVLEFWDSFISIAAAMFLCLLVYFGSLIFIYALDWSEEAARLAKYILLPTLFLILMGVLAQRHKVRVLKSGNIAALSCQAWQVLNASILGYGALGWVFLMAIIGLFTGIPTQPTPTGQ